MEKTKEDYMNEDGVKILEEMVRTLEQIADNDLEIIKNYEKIISIKDIEIMELKKELRNG